MRWAFNNIIQVIRFSQILWNICQQFIHNVFSVLPGLRRHTMKPIRLGAISIIRVAKMGCIMPFTYQNKFNTHVSKFKCTNYWIQFSAFSGMLPGIKNHKLYWLNSWILSVYTYPTMDFISKHYETKLRKCTPCANEACLYCSN